MTAEELHRKIYEKGVIEAWSRIVIEKFEAKINKLHIGQTNSLAQSFKYIRRPDKVTFSFDKYGRFVDMGVGGRRVRSKRRKIRSRKSAWTKKPTQTKEVVLQNTSPSNLPAHRNNGKRIRQRRRTND